MNSYSCIISYSQKSRTEVPINLKFSMWKYYLQSFFRLKDGLWQFANIFENCKTASVAQWIERSIWESKVPHSIPGQNKIL